MKSSWAGFVFAISALILVGCYFFPGAPLALLFLAGAGAAAGLNNLLKSVPTDLARDPHEPSHPE